MFREKKENWSIIDRVRKKGRRIGKQEPWYKRLSLKGFFPKKKTIAKDKAIRKVPKPQPSKQRQSVTQAAAVAVLLFVVVRSALHLLQFPVPTYVPSAELNQRLDALFTAFNAQDVVRAEKVQSDLRKTAGKGVDEDAIKFVDALIEDAKYGEWKSATERLYLFIMPKDSG